MYDMKHDKAKEGGTGMKGSTSKAKTGHMEHKVHHPGGNESYVLSRGVGVGLYLKDMGRSKGY
jgi:hypothetical protein